VPALVHFADTDRCRRVDCAVLQRHETRIREQSFASDGFNDRWSEAKSVVQQRGESTSDVCARSDVHRDVLPLARVLSFTLLVQIAKNPQLRDDTLCHLIEQAVGTNANPSLRSLSSNSLVACFSSVLVLTNTFVQLLTGGPWSLIAANAPLSAFQEPRRVQGKRQRDLRANSLTARV
jgi:hypothetical protein